MIGLYGRKRGMAAIFADGKHTAVTIIEVGPCPIVQVKSEDRDKYRALQMAFEPVQEKSINKPRAGHFARAGVAPHRVLGEFRNFEGNYKPGDVLNVGLFKAGDVVDVTGVSKGRGFAGVIKRYRFNRPNQSHGTHEIFRGTGSVGAGTFPGRVWPGKRMPGRMGGDRVTVKHLTVLQIDDEKGMMIVKGAVPGAPGGVVRIRISSAH
jgi:large subunit ribosomal protein L3